MSHQESKNKILNNEAQYKTHECDKFSELDILIFKPPAKAYILFLNIIVIFFALIIMWSFFAKIDEITIGTGEVVPSKHSQIIQSLDGGILKELLIKEGDIVKKDQILMRLNSSDSGSIKEETAKKVIYFKIKKQRLEAEAKGVELNYSKEIESLAPKLAETEIKFFNSRNQEYKNALSMLDKTKDSIKAQIEEMNYQIEKDNQNSYLIKKELDITAKMVSQKAAPQVDEIRLRRQLNEVFGSIKISKEKRTSLEAEYAAVNEQIKDQSDKFKSQALGELNQVEAELATLEEKIKPMNAKIERAEIRSPVEGIINNIAIRTIGGVIEPAMKLVEIVPLGDELKVQAKIAPSDIAFIKEGQTARVRLSAYDAARYGYLIGMVTRVGASSINDQDNKVYFEIEVKTDKSHLGTEEHPLPISSGMIAEVHVITGNKTVIEYLTKPFLRIKDRAFTER